MIKVIDGLPCRLQTDCNLDFLSAYGRVFRVLDDQDSGNLCFGLERGERRYFLKFAGAQTLRYQGTPEQAVKRLKQASAIYMELSHPCLIPYHCSEKVGDGFVMIFDWVDAICMGKQYPGQREQFMALPQESLLDVFEAVLEFHRYVAKRGYVAIDFYDGSILYDRSAHKPYICDIDFYQKSPTVNTMGRMWGSSRFMSPEEHTLGAVVDEVTTVYTMGATAFALFGGEAEHTLEKWSLSEECYRVAMRAVASKRSERYPTLAALTAAWKLAK